MSDQLLYWAYMGVAFVLTLGIGYVFMKKTNKFALSFYLSTAVNVLIFTYASFWWARVTEAKFQVIFGLAFYGIAFVNVVVIDLFALVSMRNKTNESQSSSQK